MKPPFPRVHSCTVHHPIEVFFGLTMDCGKQFGQADVVFDPIAEPAHSDRPHITCPTCREILPVEQGKTYAYGLIDRGELRNYFEARGRECGEGEVA